jgi:two-component system NarL family sensor kinase
MKLSDNRAISSRKGERAKWLDRIDYASFFVPAPAVLVLLDPDLKVLMASARLAEVCGITGRELLGKTPAALLPSIAPGVERILRRVTKTGTSRLNFEVTGELPISPGVPRYWKASCFPVARGPDGRYAIGVISTETTTAGSNELLPHLESGLREVLNLAHEGTWEANCVTGHDVWSPEVYEILGVDTRTTASFDVFRSLIHEDDRRLPDDNRASLVQGVKPFNTQLRTIPPNGEGRVIRCCGTLVRRPADEPIGIISLIQDITPQFEAERVLRESEARMETLLGSIDDVISELDVEGRVLNLWTRNDQLLVRPREDIVGKTVEQLLGTEFFDPWRPVLKRVLKSGVSENLTYPLTVRAGPRWFASHIAPIRSADGSFKSLCVLSRDVTKLKTTEQSLHRLSSSLLNIQDHERRRTSQFLHETTVQSLLAVKLNLRAVARDHSIGDHSRNILSATLDLVDGTIQEVRTLSYLLHPPMLDEAGLASALQCYVKGFSERSEIILTLEVADGFGRFSREIEMMMFRLVTGSLSNIHRHSGSRKAAIRLMRAPNEIMIEIEDWGCGISTERLSAAENGTLGVGIVGMRERVAEHGGKLVISSQPGSGTTVRLVLPVGAAASVAGA